MKVKEIMKTNVIKILKNTTCKEAAKIFLENRISGAPVVDENEKLVGVISEKDLFRALFPTYKEFYESPESYLDFEKLEKETHNAVNKKVEEVMGTRLITATPETAVLKIAAQMIASGIHRVPVVENGRIVGMVSRRDIYSKILKKYLGL